MNDITIVFICAVVVVFLIASFLLGRMQGIHRERMSLLKTLCDLHGIDNMDKHSILDELERVWNT